MAVIVHTAKGDVSGISGKMAGTMAYLGIPYAKAPVGCKRFTPAEETDAWAGVRKCDHLSPAPIQVLRPADEPLEMSEDCLTLNIYTSENEAKNKPVLFWIFGGGFMGGSNADPEFDGSALAAKGAVVVVINYRVSALGFFSTQKLEEKTGFAGNAGLCDQIAALKWVQQNIAAFGGDPQRVTIFGQSAGGMSVRMLLTSPLTDGLFSRAIVESGGGLNEGDLVRPKEEFQRLCAECLNRLGWTEDDILNRDAQEVSNQLVATAKELLAGKELALFQPFVDGVTLEDVPGKKIARGETRQIPVICGTVAGDSWMFSRKVRAQVSDPALFRGFCLTPSQAWGRQQILLHKDPIRTYFMDRTQPPKEQTYYSHGAPPFGADTPHGTEVAYVFGTLAVRGQGHAPLDDALSETMQRYWINFAATGDPNGDGLPHWPVFSGDQQTLHIGDDGIQAEQVVHNEAEDHIITYTMQHPGMLTTLEGF